MDKISLEKQILSTNDWGLLGILNEGLLDRCEDIKVSIGNEEYENIDGYGNAIREIISELLVIFRMDNEISNNLREIYIFLNKLVTEGIRSKEIKKFEEAQNILAPIVEAFRERELKEDANIISGLTYGEKDLEDYKTSSTKTFEI